MDATGRKKKTKQLSCLDMKFEQYGFLANDRKVPVWRKEDK